jgi:hypothetical protein
MDINRQNFHKEYKHLLLQDPPKFTQTAIFGLKICKPSGNTARVRPPLPPPTKFFWRENVFSSLSVSSSVEAAKKVKAADGRDRGC